MISPSLHSLEMKNRTTKKIMPAACPGNNRNKRDFILYSAVIGIECHADGIESDLPESLGRTK
jgi:hypothetical protein